MQRTSFHQRSVILSVAAALIVAIVAGAVHGDAGQDSGLAGLAKRLATADDAPAAASPSPQRASPAETVAEEADAVVSETEQLPLGGGRAAAEQSQSLGFGRAGTRSGAESGAGAPAHNSGRWVLDTLTALGIVIGLIFLFRAIARRRWPNRMASATSSSVVDVLARVAVAPRSHVLLLKLGRRILVVGESPAGMAALADVENPEEVADLLEAVQKTSPNSISNSFSQLLGRFNGAYRPDERATDEGTDDGEISVDHARNRISALLSRLRRSGAGPRSGVVA